MQKLTGSSLEFFSKYSKNSALTWVYSSAEMNTHRFYSSSPTMNVNYPGTEVLAVLKSGSWLEFTSSFPYKHRDWRCHSFLLQVLSAAPTEAHLVFRERSNLSPLRERLAELSSFIPALNGRICTSTASPKQCQVWLRENLTFKKRENKISQEKSKNFKRFTAKNLEEEINVLSSLYTC